MQPGLVSAVCLNIPAAASATKTGHGDQAAGTLAGAAAKAGRGEMQSVYAVQLFPYVVEEYLAAWQPFNLAAVSVEAGQPQPIYL